MCGIVAASSTANIVPFLIDGLQRLEYRGYDSAGMALLQDARLKRVRCVGRVQALAESAKSLNSTCGVAHTRWATHGAPSEANAHPQISAGLAVVHNGIIENFDTLRLELVDAGFVFHSETDSETVAHLIQYYLGQGADLLAAVRRAAQRLVGAFAIAVLDENHPSHLVVARQGSPLLIGVVDANNTSANNVEGVYAASDVTALLPVTRRILYLDNGEMAVLTPNAYQISRVADATPVERTLHESQLSPESVDLGHYRHYMQKEIFEQPEALASTLELIGGSTSLQAGIFGAAAVDILPKVDSVLVLACGTSYYAGLTVRYWIESLAALPCTVEIASEYVYRTSVPSPRQLIVLLSQSGETADTLAALRHARELGQNNTLVICNVAESSLVRECNLRFITRAGPEIGVASTKAFTTQLVALFMLTLSLAKARNRLAAEEETRHLEALRHLPLALDKVLGLEEEISDWANRFAGKRHALFLGRGLHYPIALEGALKLKEISYIHAEAYPAGELKHGPLALVDTEMPVIAVAPNDSLLEKLKSNLNEVRARGGELYVFADADSVMGESTALHIIRLPEHYGLLSPVLHVAPLQLLAYHVALVKGTDIDKPRNLAKSVTVE